MDIRRGVAGVGRTMITGGVLILLFVAYQLWGTGLTEARYQRKLTRQFESLLAQPAPPFTTPTAASSTAPPGPGATAPAPGATAPAPTPPATLGQGPPPAPAGGAVAIIKIPRIKMQKAVVEGVTLGLLKRGPGHYPSTPMPGEPGNAALAGHRTTYGAPFGRINDLSVGDPILVTTRQGRFRYEVTRKFVVRPDDNSVLRQGDENLLTLTTCHPRFSAARRLIVVATLTGEAADVAPAPAPTATAPLATTPSTAVDPGGPATTAPQPSATGPTTAGPATTATTAPSLADLEEGEEGVSGRSAANGPAVAWGMAAAAVWLLTWLVARRWRKWPAYLLGTPVFLVVLFVFFENFSRLLPANF